MHYKTLLSLSTISLLCLSCESQQESGTAEIPAIPVIVVSAVVKDIPVYLESLGTLHPSIFMEINPQTHGTLLEVLINEGDWVQQGTPLFKIDPRSCLIKIREAEAQLAMDQSEFKAAQKKLNRYRHLAQKDLVAQTEWDSLESEVERSQSNIHLAEARLTAIKLDLENCTLKSPVAGRVGRLDVHPGLLIPNTVNTPLATISNVDPLIVEFSVTEKEFMTIPKENLQFEIKALCSPEICREGTITFFDNHFDPKTGLLLVRGKIPNSDYSLRPGQSVHVSIKISTTSNAKVIPQKSIKYNQQGAYVYIVQPDMTISTRQLVLGDEQGTDQIILEGIEPSESIVLDGHLRLSPGIKVDVRS